MTSDNPDSPDSSDTDGETGRPRTPSTPAGRWLVETALLILVAFALAQGIRTFIGEPYVIPTGSMVPTIGIGDRVIAEKLTFRFVRKPARGDIVVFSDPRGSRPQLIKRVIATEGQTVDIRGDAVYVDGKMLVEPYTHGKPTTLGSVATPVRVPTGHLWLMGDNRTNSADSRFIGTQPVSAIRGRALLTYWPPRAFGALD